MTENLKLFIEKVSSNAELRKKLMEANENHPDEEENRKVLIVLAKDLGMELTEEDFLQSESKELDEKELDTVSGGTYTVRRDGDGNSFGTYSDCFCAFGGGGSACENQKACACVLAGVGELTAYGKEMAKKGFIETCGTKSKPVAMYCPAIGCGWK